jgi:hypothetical protein
MVTDRRPPKPLPEDQHLFEPPPPIEVTLPTMLVSGYVNLTLRFEADVVRLVHDHPQEYAAAAERKGYAPFEQAKTFLWDLVSEHLEVFLAPCPGLEDKTFFDDAEVEFRWTPQMAEELNEKLAELA